MLKPALLIVDMQEAYYRTATGPARQCWEDALEYVNEAIKLFRKKNLPVIAVENIEREEGFIPGADGFSSLATINLVPGDIRVRKERGSAFYQTELLEKMAEKGIDGFILCGYCAEWCILATLKAAADLDISAIVLKGSLISRNPERIGFVEDISECVTFGALEAFLS